MLEKALIKAIHKYLPKLLHHQSNTSGSLTHNGIPDQYYDGTLDDLWVEYKQLGNMPRDGIVGRVDAKKRGCYSPLQFDWMCRRWRHRALSGGDPNVLGVVGLPNRTAVVQYNPVQWEEGTSVAEAMTYAEVAEIILGRTGPPMEK